MNLSEKVRKTIEQYGLLSPGDRVVVGLSGGADSLCLIEVLRELRYEIRAVHVNHGLRKNADKDEEYVREYCRRTEIPLSVVRVEAGRFAKEQGISTEEAGRILRKHAFSEECVAWKKEESTCLLEGVQPDCTEEPDSHREVRYRIALAHHLEDSAETLLFNLCRGSRTAGVSGIRPEAGDIIHPLLTVSRPEIERYLTERAIPWCTDETNASDCYTRNRTRHMILPMLERELNSAATIHIAEAALEFAECEDHLLKETEKAMKRTVTILPEEAEGVQKSAVIDLPALCEQDRFMQKRIVYETLVRCAGQKKDIMSQHVTSILEMPGAGGRKQLSLPYGLHAIKNYDQLKICPVETEEERDILFTIGESLLPLRAEDYRTRVFSRPSDALIIPSGECTKWFDYDKIAPFFSFRTPLEGDRMTIGTDGTRKRLSRIFIDCKVPHEMRKRIMLAVSGDEILWVPGYRISAAFPVTDETKTILEISIRSADK